jgi:N-acetylglutamate synthase-like GNAT family acetyltransferase
MGTGSMTSSLHNPTGMTASSLEKIDARFDDWQSLLDLISHAFSYMNEVIDPPSSATRLTLQSLKEKASAEIGYVVRQADTLCGCAFFRPEAPDFLYIGKLAIAPYAQGNGLGRLFLERAIVEARTRGLPKLRLETRVELTGNHACFARWGFEKTAEKAHPGFDRPTFIEMQRNV